MSYSSAQFLSCPQPEKVGNHTFHGTGITAYLKNGGTLEKAREMANHADTRTTRSTIAAPRTSASTT